MLKTFRITLIFLLMPGLVSWITGCAPPPPEKQHVEKVIREYFETRRFSVREVRMAGIDRNALRDRDYMAPLTFVVQIPYIRLESLEDRGDVARFRKGNSVTFRNASIELRRGGGPAMAWEVGRVSGIEIP